MVLFLLLLLLLFLLLLLLFLLFVLFFSSLLFCFCSCSCSCSCSCCSCSCSSCSCCCCCCCCCCCLLLVDCWLLLFSWFWSYTDINSMCIYIYIHTSVCIFVYHIVASFQKWWYSLFLFEDTETLQLHVLSLIGWLDMFGDEILLWLLCGFTTNFSGFLNTFPLERTRMIEHLLSFVLNLSLRQENYNNSIIPKSGFWRDNVLQKQGVISCTNRNNVIWRAKRSLNMTRFQSPNLLVARFLAVSGPRNQPPKCQNVCQVKLQVSNPPTTEMSKGLLLQVSPPASSQKHLRIQDRDTATCTVSYKK